MMRSRLVLLALLSATIAAAPSAAAAGCWYPPVDAPVVDPFRQPDCPWCPGNRGVEYGTPPGALVRAAAAGTVTFAGTVAGTDYLVVRLADGRRHTYGGVRDAAVGVGDPVVAGARIAATDGRLHFGLRDGDAYLDPAPSIGELRHRVRLIPLDDSTPRPAPDPRLTCPNAAR